MIDVYTPTSQDIFDLLRPCAPGVIVVTEPGDDATRRVLLARSDVLCSTHLKPWPCQSGPKNNPVKRGFKVAVTPQKLLDWGYPYNPVVPECFMGHTERDTIE